MSWEIMWVPVLLCFVAGVLAAATWLEQVVLAAHQVVPLRVAEQQAPSQRQGEIPSREGVPWVADTPRFVA